MSPSPLSPEVFWWRQSSDFGLLDAMPWGLIGYMQNKHGFTFLRKEKACGC